jgi:hypothetical protein
MRYAVNLPRSDEETMSELMETQPEEIHPTNWRSRTIFLGGIIGSLLGAVAAYLYVRAAEETYGDQPPELATGDAVKVGTALLRILRQIAELGVRR